MVQRDQWDTPWGAKKIIFLIRDIDGPATNYAEALYKDHGATLDDLREAVKTLVETERIARRVLGGSHPITKGIEYELRDARAALTAREPKK